MPCFEVGLSPSGLTQPQNKAYTFAFHGLACITIQCVRYYIIVLIHTREVFFVHRYIHTCEVFFIHRYIPMNNFLPILSLLMMISMKNSMNLSIKKFRCLKNHMVIKNYLHQSDLEE